MKEEDWAYGWKKYYHPTLIGQRVVVCPTWEDYQPQGDQVVVRLDPGLAFGTGTHQTTRLCIRQLERYVVPGCSLLDMGCGSGILSMVALALAPGRAVGIDIDPTAARIARENVEQAGLNQGRFAALCADVIQDTTLPGRIGTGFDLIAANIVADAIVAVCPSFPTFLRPGGTVITSGIISERMGEVSAALRAPGAGDCGRAGVGRAGRRLSPACPSKEGPMPRFFVPLFGRRHSRPHRGGRPSPGQGPSGPGGGGGGAV